MGDDDDAKLSDDIILEIFLQLPVKYIFQYRSLSNLWNRALSDPSFCARYRRKSVKESKTTSSSSQQLLGFFQVSKSRCWALTMELPAGAPNVSFLSVCKQGKPLLVSRPLIKKLGFILGCSNGLILCGRHPMTYFVCNPLTNQCLPLPRPNQGCSLVSVVIGFYYCQEFHRYLVVRVETRGDPCTNIMHNRVPIETYSSDTRMWKQSVLTAPDGFVLVGRWPCTVQSGVFYWLTHTKSIVAYDPSTAADKLWSIKMPYERTHGWDVPRLTETELDGLLQCGYDDADVGFRIFVLPKKLKEYCHSLVIPETEWRQHYLIDIKPRVPYDHYNYHPHDNRVDLNEGPLLIAFHPENSNMVFFRKDLKIFCYDRETSKTRMIQFVGQAFPWKHFHLFPYFHPQWPPSPFP